VKVGKGKKKPHHGISSTFTFISCGDATVTRLRDQRKEGKWERGGKKKRKKNKEKEIRSAQVLSLNKVHICASKRDGHPGARGPKGIRGKKENLSCCSTISISPTGCLQRHRNQLLGWRRSTCR